MGETSRERQGALVRGVMDILAAFPDGLPARDVLARLEDVVPPTPYEDSFYPKNPQVRRREKAVRFATISFVKAGWLRKEKGVWWVTPEGLAARDQFPDPGELARESVRLYREWKRTQAPDPDDFDEAEVTDVPETTSVLEEAQESSWAEITAYVLGMNPYDFQKLVAALLRAMGYHVHYDSPPGRDDGIDVMAYLDPLGVSGPRVKVQVKRRADRASLDEVKSFVAGLGTTDVGLYVSAGGFTNDAERFARVMENRRVTLINLERMFDLWVEHYGGIAEVERARLPLRPVYFLDPRE